MEERTFKGYNGDLVMSDDGVRIEGGVKRSAMTRTLRGQKVIPWETIVAVQYRKANLAGVGYLQLSLRGGYNRMLWTAVLRKKAAYLPG